MNSRFVQLILVIATLSGFALWLTSRHRETPAIEIPVAIASPKPIQPNVQTLASTPEAQTFLARNDFERRTRDFLREAASLNENTRIERARALNAEIDDREQTKEFSAGEAIMLRIGLIQATVTDERERARQTQTLIDRYRHQAELGETRFLAQQRNDARFQAYKAEESKVVSEVLAMQEYPDGMSQDDYLRERLQQAREYIYGLPIQELPVPSLVPATVPVTAQPPQPPPSREINPEKPPTRSTRVVEPAQASV